MKHWIKYPLTITLGMLFAWVLTASQAISWYRIQEMFAFKSFHMYGLLGSAIITGMLSLFLIKHFQFKGLNPETPKPKAKPLQWKANLIGGLCFGVGWGISGACSAPLFILVGLKWSIGLSLLFGALIGTLIYGLLQKSLPHE